MPKKNGKGKRQGKATAQADDDVDESASGSTTSTSSLKNAEESSRRQTVENRQQAADPKQRGQSNLSVPEDVVIEACRRGEMRMLRRWAKRGVKVCSTSPLYFAVLYGNIDVIRCLVEDLNADVNRAGGNNRAGMNEWTPLRAAAKHSVATLRCLLDLDADASLAMLDGYAPLHIAAKFGKIDVI
jgi:hypothetical protein